MIRTAIGSNAVTIIELKISGDPLYIYRHSDCLSTIFDYRCVSPCTVCTLVAFDLVLLSRLVTSESRLGCGPSGLTHPTLTRKHSGCEEHSDSDANERVFALGFTVISAFRSIAFSLSSPQPYLRPASS
jgi:hypothetical protein